MTSTARSAMRLASSWMVMASGIDHFADDLFLARLEAGGLLLLALLAPPQRRQRPRPAVVFIEGVGDRQLAAPALGFGACLGRLLGLHVAPRLARPAFSLLCGFRLGSGHPVDPVRCFLGLALLLCLALESGFFLDLAGLGGGLLQCFALFKLGALARFFFGAFAVLGFAHARFHQNAAARLLFILSEGAQDHPRAGLLLRCGAALRDVRSRGFTLRLGACFDWFRGLRDGALALGLDHHRLGAAVRKILPHPPDRLGRRAPEAQFAPTHAGLAVFGIVRFSHTSFVTSVREEPR